nr:retrotransposon Orf1 [Tanacetum cinerariifolium]
MEDHEGIRGISNFTLRIKGMHIFVGNFTYILDFMIVEDISLIIDPKLLQVVLGKPFVEISNMTRVLSLGIVKFVSRTDEIAYKMPLKIEKFSLLSNLEKEHMKSVSFRNEDDKRRGVNYVMNKILGFYKECLELGPEYLTRLEEEEIYLNLAHLEKKRTRLQLHTKVDEENVYSAGDGITITRDGVRIIKRRVREIKIASELNRHSEALVYLAGRWRQDYNATPSRPFS